MFKNINTTIFKLVFIVFLSTSFFGFSHSINNLNFSNWNKGKGLPNNVITSLTMDELGFLWVGTYDGLCRFNGPGSFEIYKSDSNEKQNTNSLAVNHIRSLFSDSEGYLWIGTLFGGLTRHSPTKGTWKTFMHHPNKTSDFDNIISIFEDSKNQLWIGHEAGLSLFNKNTETFQHFKPSNTDIHTTISGGVLSIMEDSNGWLWVGNWAGGIYLLLEDENGKYEPENVRQFYEATSKTANNAWVIYQDKNDRHWIGTTGAGVLLMNLPENASNKVKQQNWKPHFQSFKFGYSGSNTARSNNIQDIHQDQFNNLWVATCNGLFKIPGMYLTGENVHKAALLTNYDIYIPSIDDKSITGEYVTKILEDKQGLIWLSTSEGLSQYNPQINQFKNSFFNDEYIRLSPAPCIAIDASQDIWISAPSEGLKKYKIEGEKLTETDNISSLVLGSVLQSIHLKNERWMYAATEEGITSIDLKTKKSKQYPFPNWLKTDFENTFVNAILIDRLGFIWLGAFNGLFRINTNTGVYDVLLNDPNNPNTITHNAITSIIEDSKGNIWVGTYQGLNRIADITSKNIVFERFFQQKSNTKQSFYAQTVFAIKEVNEDLYIGTYNGLYRYNSTTNKIEHLNEQIDDFRVSSIEAGIKNDVWLSSTEGIYNYNIKNKSFRIFDKKDLSANISYRLGASCVDKNKNIYFANINGITHFSLKNFPENEIALPAYISDIKIENKNGDRFVNGTYLNEIELNHNDYRLSIEYGTPNYYRADKNKYVYRLKGMEDAWREIEFGTPIVYTNLGPKEYRLELKASNNDGIWSEEVSTIAVIKHPPYWETWWFRLLAIMLVAVLILSLFFWYTNKIRKHNEALQRYNDTLNIEISNRKRVEQKLHDYNSELKRSNSDLEQFAYITSHDLKEPLRVVSSFSNLLSQKYINKLDDNASLYIKFINDGVNRMISLVDSLLTYSLVGQKDSVYNSFNLNKLIKGKVSDLSQLIKEKNAIVNIENLPEIIGHQEQIGMVFYNLINNALKY